MLKHPEELQRQVIILCGFVITYDTFHITHGNLIHC